MEPYEQYEPHAAASAGAPDALAGPSHRAERHSRLRTVRVWMAHVGSIVFGFLAAVAGFALGWPEPLIAVVAFAVGGGLYLLGDSADLSDYLPPDQPD